MLSTSDPELVALLEAGTSSVVVGMVTDQGEPFATRGWGVKVVSTDPLQLRINLSAGEAARLGRRGGDPGPYRLAITCSDVATLRSVQAKGLARDLQEADADDHERFVDFVEEFFDTVHRVDGHVPMNIGRMAPKELVVCTLDVTELYDQTPGPQAGARLAAGAAGAAVGTAS